ncbi:MAG: tyrosine-protein phosphatase [Deltaproteobacteria bacterium]|nr:tyrosine-protein phosphatase [Deltaproteobacteria bacterium]
MLRTTLSIFSILVLFATAVFGDFGSPFPSEVPNLDTPNSHLLFSKAGYVYRGSAPRNEKEIRQLIKLGINHVLIFKNQTKDEVAVELKRLREAGLKKKGQVEWIKFVWKDIEFKEGCTQTIQALKLLVTVSHNKKQRVFFHCTVGEDRTGYLAGLFRVLIQKWDIEKAFDKELCERGYEAGNPDKPDHVVQKIRDGLTPLFLKMVYLIDTGAITADKLDESVCKKDPGNETDFGDNKKYRVDDYRCE